MSKSATFASANVNGIVANIKAATLPVATPNICAPSQRVTRIKMIPAEAVGNRMANSDSPNNLTHAICSQWNSTGLSI